MTLFEHSRLVVAPRRSFRLARHFDLADEAGRGVGAIIGDGIRFQLVDGSSKVVARLERPWVLFRTKVIVWEESGSLVGAIHQTTPLARIRFAMLDASGAGYGSVEPEGVGARSFRLTDARGDPVAHIERRLAFVFRSGEYVLSLAEQVGAPSRLVALAAIVGIDKAVTRRRRGSGGPAVEAGSPGS